MKKSISEWYIKHKIKILTAVIFILIIFLINRILVFFSDYNNKSDSLSTQNILNESITSKYNSISIDSTESVTLGGEMNKSQVESLSVIDSFIAYCNEKKVNEAYELLSDDCKNELYSNVENFREYYYNKVFNGHKKTVSIENWNENTYKVYFDEDVLSTGQYIEGNTIQDFITIVLDIDGNKKLNINGYIKKQELNNVTNKNDVEVTAIESDIYKDYQTVTFKIINNTNSEILIDDKVYSETMYLEDENGIKYPAYSNEISESELRLSAKQTKELTIKYYNSYGTRKNITSIVFSGVVFNYSENATKQYESIIIDLS